MPSIATWQELKELASYVSTGAPVISLYLDVDGGTYPRPQQYIAGLNQLAKASLHDWRDAGKPDHRSVMEVRNDISRIETYVSSDFVRERTRGLVIFSCASGDLWRVIKLPTPVESKLVISSEPFTRPLLAALSRYDRFCAVVVDKRKARVFTVYLGDIQEQYGLTEDEVPAHVKTGEWAGLRGNKISNHIDDHIHRHLRNVAAELLEFFKENEFDNLIVGGHPDFLPRFIDHLHPYLVERIAGTFKADPAMPLDVILRGCLRVDEESRAKRQAQLVAKLVNENAPGGRGVTGSRETAAALNSGMVYLLVVAPDFPGPVFTCADRHVMAIDPGSCPTCGQPLTAGEDPLEEVIQIAVKKGVQVQTYTAKLPDEVGGIGAFLRYPG